MIFGLGAKTAKKAAKKTAGSSLTRSKTVTKKTPRSSQADEAAAMLKKMQAKKDAGACPFC